MARARSAGAMWCAAHRARLVFGVLRVVAVRDPVPLGVDLLAVSVHQHGAERLIASGEGFFGQAQAAFEAGRSVSRRGDGHTPILNEP